MTDIIRLLPDAVANQIAAGEVIQRPASVVKELVENAVDAKASQIQVIISDAGKSLIKVVDNGIGMSDSDARLSLERHATSKLHSADDLFAITSKGFRGEALASMASISQMEIRTKQEDVEIGTRILTEGSKIKLQEPISHPTGTSIEVRKLFYNVPARRKFLKSNPVEFKHISEEFARIALAHPEVDFDLFHNDSEVYRLRGSNPRLRTVGILGKRINEMLVPVSEQTTYVEIEGFVGKPEASRKTRGDQYLFVNKRFIKSPYLNHAIRMAFEDIIADDHYPLYVLFLTIDPSKIDVNVHPTKQEIKFEDERLIYNYLRVSVRHALGKYSVTPTLDFNQERAFTQGVKGQPEPPRLDPRERSNVTNWESFYQELQTNPQGEQTVTIQSTVFGDDDHAQVQTDQTRNPPIQLHNTLLISQIKSGAVAVDQQAAHERILFERFLAIQDQNSATVQKALFPFTVELSRAEAVMLREILPAINQLGFEIEDFGHDSFIIQGTPASLDSDDSAGIVRQVLAQYEQDLDPSSGLHVKVAKALSLSAATKRGTYIAPEERQQLIDMLFACENPYTSPSGRKCFIVLELDDLLRRFT